MIRIGMVALALSLAGCASFQLAATPAPMEDEITHVDPMPVNLTGEWDAVLVIVPEDGLRGRPAAVADVVRYRHGTEAPVLGVLFVDTAYVEVWLCESIVDEDGPRCDGPALRVEGLEEIDTTGWPFRSAANVEWLENARLFGRVERR